MRKTTRSSSPKNKSDIVREKMKLCGATRCIKQFPHTQPEYAQARGVYNVLCPVQNLP